MTNNSQLQLIINWLSNVRAILPATFAIGGGCGDGEFGWWGQASHEAELGVHQAGTGEGGQAGEGRALTARVAAAAVLIFHRHQLLEGS